MKAALPFLLPLLVAALVFAAPSDLTTSGNIDAAAFYESGSTTLTNDITGNAATATQSSSASNLSSCDNCLTNAEIDESSLSGTATGLTAGNLTCVDCIGSTEIADVYLGNDGGSASGTYDFDSGTLYLSASSWLTVGSSVPLGENLYVADDGMLVNGTISINSSSSYPLWRIYPDYYGGLKVPGLVFAANRNDSLDVTRPVEAMFIMPSYFALGGNLSSSASYQAGMYIGTTSDRVAIGGTTGASNLLTIGDGTRDATIRFQNQSRSVAGGDGSIFEEEDECGTVSWTNPAEAATSDDTYATASSSTIAVTKCLMAMGFGFSIPESATIVGVEIEVERLGDSGVVSDDFISIVVDNKTQDQDASDGAVWSFKGGDETVTFGSETELWGVNLTPAIVNDDYFGAAISAQIEAEGIAKTASIDQITVTVYYATAYSMGVDGDDGDAFKLATGDHLGVNDLLTIETTGHVGLGTNEPNATFHLNGSMRQDPVQPVLAGRIQDATNFDQAWGVVAANKIAFMTSYGGDSVSSFDVTDPYNPRVLDILVDATYLNGPRDAIFLLGRYLYVGSVDAGPDYFNIIDVSDPSDLKIVSSIAGSFEGSDRFWNIDGIHVQGGYAYLNLASDDFYVVDVSDPRNPFVVGNLSTTSPSFLHDPRGLDVQGDYAYVAASGNRSLAIIDISDPYNPTLAGRYENDDYFYALRGLDVEGPYAYLAGYTNDTLAIVDISDPTAPTLTGRVTDATYLDAAMQVQVVGDYAYVLAAADKLTIVDVSDPSAPSIVESYSPMDNSRGPFVIDGRFGYFGGQANDYFQVFDLGGAELPTASIGNLQVSQVNADRDISVEGGGRVFGSLNVGPRGLSVQGDLSVTGRHYNVVPRMYLTSTTHDGDHDCDTNPWNCCEPGYHMCTPPEFRAGGREVEMSGDDRDTSPYNTNGWVDAKVGSTSYDCNGWTTASSSYEGYTCKIGITLTCSVTFIPSCATTYGIWCCTD